MNNKEKFINLMKNDIFGLDRELNFGIYHIFKISKNQIEKLLKDIAQNIDDDIYDYLYNFFSLYYEGGDFGYTKRAFATFTIPYIHKEYQLNSKEKCSFDSSHSFFYDGEETKFTWKTEDSYYIKSTKYFNKLVAKIDNYDIVFQVVGEDKGFDSKKTRVFKLLSAKKDENKIILNFNISNHQTPKHSIYLVVKNMIDNDIDDLENITSEEFEKIPPKNSIFTNFEIDKYKKYLFKDSKSIFENKKVSEENNTQIFSYPKLYITKKEYVEKIYTKNDLKKMLDKKAIDIDNDIGIIFKKDKNLEFFYRLDRAFNDFITGVDSDYFIHKNLKRFLLTELDKFIKNYVLYDTEKLLSKEGEDLREKALIFKEKAEKLIEFLAAVEEFQKYIWEKRKLIKKINYIISSNKIIDENILKKVLENKKQISEWIEELGLCENKPTIDELKNNPYPIDTRYFDDEFKYKILSQFDNLEEETDGILIKSENFQALKFLEPKFKETIKCIYIDPPYNTGNDGFVYKDKYKESSWLSMMNDRLRLAKELMRDDSMIFNHIDDNEIINLSSLYKKIFYLIDTITLQVKSASGVSSKLKTLFMDVKEYIVCGAKTDKYSFQDIFVIKEYINECSKTIQQYTYLLKNLGDIGKKEFSFKIDKNKTTIDVYEVENFEWENIPKQKRNEKFYLENIEKIVRTAAFSSAFKKQFSNKKDKVYYFKYKLSRGENKGDFAEIYVVNGEQLIFLKDSSKIIEENNRKRLVKTEKLSNIWTDISWTGIANEGKVKLKSGKKPEKLLERIINLSIPKDERMWVLDFFAGSGTTPAVAYKMNKKFIGIEINDYFDDLLLKRMKYTMFGNSGGIESKKEKGLIQYFYLQQYDEIIENLEIETPNINIQAEFIFNPLKNKINEVEIKPTLEILFSFVFHRGFKLKSIKKEDYLIGECEEGVIVLGEGKEDFEKLLDKFKENLKIYTNLKPINGKNPDKNRIEIISNADFKGI